MLWSHSGNKYKRVRKRNVSGVDCYSRYEESPIHLFNACLTLAEKTKKYVYIYKVMNMPQFTFNLVTIFLINGLAILIFVPSRFFSVFSLSRSGVLQFAQISIWIEITIWDFNFETQQLDKFFGGWDLSDYSRHIEQVSSFSLAFGYLNGVELIIVSRIKFHKLFSIWTVCYRIPCIDRF